jgi:hypothetical protein
MQTSDVRHIEFEYLGDTASGKTSRWRVYNLTTDAHIGVVQWAPNFRKYAFYPFHDTYYDANCLEDIAEFVREQTVIRKEQRESNN